MKISVASGKGGTGKTTIATNLAQAIYDHGQSVVFADCDVENPNSHIFLKPELNRVETVYSTLPEVDQDICSRCGRCVDFCAYNAMVMVGGKIIVFPELCHACGGCVLVCPEKAITEIEREIGVIEIGFSQAMPVLDGVLNVGEALAPAVIKSLLTRASMFNGEVLIRDSPPGTACPMVETVRGTDYCLLVTEPTPFGLNDLEIAVDVVNELGIPHGVIINRSDLGGSEVERFCERNSIPILMRIPNSLQIARAYSEGIMMLDIDDQWSERFFELFEQIREMTR